MLCSCQHVELYLEATIAMIKIEVSLGHIKLYPQMFEPQHTTYLKSSLTYPILGILE